MDFKFEMNNLNMKPWNYKPFLFGILGLVGIMLGAPDKGRRTKTISFKWSCPPPSWAKLNTDDSSLEKHGLAGEGSLIQDSRGVWMRCCSQAIWLSTSV
jgi:hypothetical protein